MAAASTTFHVRMPLALKKKAQKIVERNGIDLPTAVRIYFTQMTLIGSIPTGWLTENNMTPEAEKALLFQIKHPEIDGTMKNTKDIDAFIDGL